MLVVAALLALAFAALYRAAQRRRTSETLLYSNLEFMLKAMRPASWLVGALFAGAAAGVLALGIALAGPRFSALVPVRDATVVFCIDTSGSMRATDLEPTRGEAAKAAARAFVDTAPDGTRFGIVSFAGAASMLLAPTADLAAVRDALERIPLPNGATAIGDALVLAADALPEKVGE